MGKKVAARISGSKGAKCTLNHPENTTIELKITKDEFRLDPAGAIPSCEAFGAIVECQGMEMPANRSTETGPGEVAGGVDASPATY